MSKFRIIGMSTALVFIVLSLGISSDTSAQTKRRKAVAKASATPKPTPSVGAEIVRQASDDNQPLILADPIVQQPQEDPSAAKIKELSSRIKRLESAKVDPDQKQKRMLLNLDILTRAEQRSETLRKQLFDMIERENAANAKLNQIDLDSRPEAIDRSAQFSGSMKPEELREARRKNLEAERSNLQSLLTQIQATRVDLQANLLRSDQLIEKLRSKLEKEIDESLTDPPQN